MNKPSERIVVFVTPAQKRAISASAEELGISISELMRRAVMAFSATSDQVKAASIVDRLNAPRQPDALAQVLQKAARPLRAGRAARPAAASPVDETSALAEDAAHASLTSELTDEATEQAADETRVNNPAREIAQAVVRLNAEAEANAQAASQHASFGTDSAVQAQTVPEPLQQQSAAGFLRRRRELEIRDVRDVRDVRDNRNDDTRSDDAAPEGGKFA